MQQVTVHPVPMADFSNGTACETYPTSFTSTSFIASGGISSYFYDFNGIGTTNTANTDFVFPFAGTFNISLTVVSDFGCSNTVVKQLVIHPIPEAVFTADPNIALANQEITFTDQTPGNIVAWEWDFGDGQGDNQSVTQHAYAPGGPSDKFVILTVYDDMGCQDTASTTIAVSLLPVLPTGFSPNNDGENDVFIIRGGPFESVDFKIYNNWGQLIFESHDGAQGWDGTYNGEPAPLGVYTWTFAVGMGNNFVVKESGDVTLIR